MEAHPDKLPPITRAMIPKSIEQQTLDTLLRIEKLLEAQAPKPVQTPAPKAPAQQTKRK